jgi:hypothetical protein
MDAKITSSIRLLPETWKTLQDFQRERRLASLGDAVHVIVEEWTDFKITEEAIQAGVKVFYTRVGAIEDVVPYDVVREILIAANDATAKQRRRER